MIIYIYKYIHIMYTHDFPKIMWFSKQWHLVITIYHDICGSFDYNAERKVTSSLVRPCYGLLAKEHVFAFSSKRHGGRYFKYIN